MTEPSTSNSDASGFAVDLGFLIYAGVWFLAPVTYFNATPNSKAALICLIVALILLALGIIFLGFELADKKISAFLLRLVTGGLPAGLWGRPSAETWQNIGIAIGSLTLSAVIHLIGINLFGATGVWGGVVKVIVLITLPLAIMFFVSAVDELLIKPLLVIPAHRLAEVPEGEFHYPQVEAGNNIKKSVRLRNRGGLLQGMKRLSAGFIVVGEIAASALVLWRIVVAILRVIT